MSVLVPDIFDQYHSNSHGHDQSFFTQAFPLSKGRNASFTDDPQSSPYSGSSLNFLDIGSESFDSQNYSFSSPLGYPQSNTDLDQFLPRSDLETSSGTVAFTYPGPSELDPRLISQNGDAKEPKSDGSASDTPDEVSGLLAFKSRGDSYNSLKPKSSLELVMSGPDGRKGNISTTKLQHGQLTPRSSSSPILDEHIVETTSDLSNGKKSKNTKRKVESDVETNRMEAPRPKRGRRSKKAKLVSKEEQQAQREKFLERNRNAAAKCRVNKKKWQEGLKDKVKDLGTQHAHLSAEFAQLQDEYDSLRAFAIPHSRICASQSLQDWVDAHAHNTFARSPPLALASNLALNIGQPAEDPSIARVNADYTDKRIIQMPSPLSGQQEYAGIERPRSAPMTPSIGNAKSENRLRAQSISTAADINLNQRNLFSMLSKIGDGFESEDGQSDGHGNVDPSKMLFDGLSAMSPSYFDQR